MAKCGIDLDDLFDPYNAIDLENIGDVVGLYLDELVYQVHDLLGDHAQALNIGLGCDIRHSNHPLVARTLLHCPFRVQFNAEEWADLETLPHNPDYSPANVYRLVKECDSHPIRDGLGNRPAVKRLIFVLQGFTLHDRIPIQ